jgi:mannan endo-1,4-beta-mannosidase
MRPGTVVGSLSAAIFLAAVGSAAGAAALYKHDAHVEIRPVVHTVSTRLSSTAHYVGVLVRKPTSHVGRITRFSTDVYKPRIVVYYSGWGESFDTSFAKLMRAKNAVTMVQMQPFGATMSGIVAGRSDRYLKRYAREVIAYGHPVILSFASEANGSWYPWGTRHTSAHEYVAAWRHVVTVFRNAGARNVTWLWDMSHERPAVAPIRGYWPGAKYVSWVGIDGYYFTGTDTFASMFRQTILDARRLAPKPILLGETAIGPVAGQALKMPNLFAGIRNYHLLGLVWFDVCQNRGIYHQCWTLEGHTKAIAEFRAGAASLGSSTPVRIRTGA